MPITPQNAQEVLKKFICPILQEVPSPENITILEVESEKDNCSEIYDSESIQEWIKKNETSPTNRQRIIVESMRSGKSLFAFVLALLDKEGEVPLDTLFADQELEEVRNFVKEKEKEYKELLEMGKEILTAFTDIAQGDSIKARLEYLEKSTILKPDQEIRATRGVIYLLSKTLGLDIKKLLEVKKQKEQAAQPTAKPLKSDSKTRAEEKARFEQAFLEEQAGKNLLTYSQSIPLSTLASTGIGTAAHARLTSEGITLAKPYPQCAIPQVPVIHPYHPTGGSPENARIDHGIPRFSLTARLTGGTYSNLPPGAEEYLTQNKVLINNVDTFISFQNKPWQNEALEFRPHPWLHQDAPSVGVYNKTSHLSVAFADLDSRFGPLTNVEATTHGEGQTTQVVFSPPGNMRITGLSDHNKTEGFYSFCLDRDTGRVAIMLHCLLNDKDQATIEEMAQGLKEGIELSMISVLMVEKLPEPITDAFGEFVYGRTGATKEGEPRYKLQEALATSTSPSSGTTPFASLQSSSTASTTTTTSPSSIPASPTSLTSVSSSSGSFTGSDAAAREAAKRWVDGQFFDLEESLTQRLRDLQGAATLGVSSSGLSLEAQRYALMILNLTIKRVREELETLESRNLDLASFPAFTPLASTAMPVTTSAPTPVVRTTPTSTTMVTPAPTTAATSTTTSTTTTTATPTSTATTTPAPEVMPAPPAPPVSPAPTTTGNASIAAAKRRNR